MTSASKFMAAILIAASSLSASAANDGGKAAFINAMAASSRDEAIFALVLDKMLEARCKKQQSVHHLKNAVMESYFSVSLAIKNQDPGTAQARLSAIPCEL